MNSRSRIIKRIIRWYDNSFMCERCRVFSYFSTSPFRVRATVYANYLLRTHPSLFFATRRPRNIFQLPDEVCDKKKKVGESARRGEASEHASTRRGGIAVMPHGRQEDRTYIRRYIFTPPCDCISFAKNFLFSLTDETGSAKNNDPGYRRAVRPAWRVGVELTRHESR